jgi:hypothetical protein
MQLLPGQLANSTDKPAYGRQFLVGVPDCAHVIKIVRSGAHWWWLLVDGHLMCLRQLLVLRYDPDSSISTAARAAISAAAVRNKDARNLQTALELGSAPLQAFLGGVGSCYVASIACQTRPCAAAAAADGLHPGPGCCSCCRHQQPYQRQLQQQ